MSMLSRFRKPGGFLQLLTLIETCEPAKQKSLLHMVSTEDPGWAHLVKIKALTFERVLTWPENVLEEITPHLSDLILANAYCMAKKASAGKNDQLHEKWIRTLPSIKAKEILNLAQSLKPEATEEFSTSIKVIQTVRELEAKGHIQFSAFDPTLEVDKRIAS